jgi:TetR/AcrR family transcriptional regulator, cholesterol catabolism regulator
MIAEPNTKVRIRQKAEELFMKYGIRSVSMDDIANALGMSKKTIYHYFVDKDELVEAVVEADINDMQSDCASVFEDSRNAVDEVFLSIDRVLEQFRNMNPMLIYDLEKFHFRGYQKFMEHPQEYGAGHCRRFIPGGPERRDAFQVPAGIYDDPFQY